MTLQDVEHRMEAVECLSSSHSIPWQGFISLHGSKHRSGKCGQQWGGERCGTWHPTAHIAAAAKVHSEVGVFGLGTRFCGFSRQEHNLQGVLGGSRQLRMLPPSKNLLIQLRPGERLPASPPSSWSISPGLALLRPPSTLSVLPRTLGRAALPRRGGCSSCQQHCPCSLLGFLAQRPQQDIPTGDPKP